jgi:hypothetical protein
VLLREVTAAPKIGRDMAEARLKAARLRFSVDEVHLSEAQMDQLVAWTALDAELVDFGGLMLALDAGHYRSVEAILDEETRSTTAAGEVPTTGVSRAHAERDKSNASSPTVAKLGAATEPGLRTRLRLRSPIRPGSVPPPLEAPRKGSSPRRSPPPPKDLAWLWAGEQAEDQAAWNARAAAQLRRQHEESTQVNRCGLVGLLPLGVK